MPEYFSITLNEADVAKLKALTAGIKDGAPKALSRAVNDTLRGAKTDMVQQVYDVYNLTKTRIRKNVDVRKFSSVSDLSGRVSAVGKPIRFMEGTDTFNFGSTVLRSGGVSAKILRNGSRQKWTRGFFQIMPKSKHWGFWQRERLPSGKVAGRLPITELSGPAAEDAFSIRTHPTSMPTVENKIQSRMDANLNKQIDFEWSKF